jgi:hypothetical protein
MLGDYSTQDTRPTSQDGPRAAQAAMQALDALYRGGDLVARPFVEWVTRLDTHAAVRTAERVYADCYLALQALANGKTSEGSAHLRRAVARARELGMLRYPRQRTGSGCRSFCR